MGVESGELGDGFTGVGLRGDQRGEGGAVENEADGVEECVDGDGGGHQESLQGGGWTGVDKGGRGCRHT